MIGKTVRKRRKALLSGCLVIAMLLTACGGGDTKTSNGTGSAPILIYVQESSINLEGGEDTWFRSAQFLNGKLYSGVYAYDEENGASVERIYTFSTEGVFQGVTELPLGEARDLTQWCVDSEENIYVTALESAQIAENASVGNVLVRLYKFDSTGSQIFRQELPQLSEQTGNPLAINDIKVDGKGRVYILYNDSILLFHENGNYDGSVAIEQRTPQALVAGEDGEVSVLCQMPDGGVSLNRIDPDRRTAEILYTDFPSIGAREPAWYGATDLLCMGNDGLYLYRGEIGEAALLLSWLDWDILSSEVRGLGVTKDGKLLVLADQGNGRERTSRLVTFVPGVKSAEADTSGTIVSSSPNSAETPPTVQIQSPGILPKDDRTVITIAVLTTDFGLENLVRAFNQSNDQYRIELAVYFVPISNSYNYDELVAPRELMNMDIALGNKGYDLILLDPESAGSLLGQGLFEDLYPYLDASENLSRGNFFDGVLEAYTVDDKLISIPKDVSVGMLVGKAEDLEDRTGLTMQELLDYWKEHPSTRLFADKYQPDVVSKLLLYGDNALVTVEGGQVVFDEELCRDLLEMFKVQDTPRVEPFTSYSIERGESLMAFEQIGDPMSVQMVKADFGSEPIALVGYPDTEGKFRLLYDCSTEFAMDINSDCKEGAWEFIEFYLDYEWSTSPDTFSSRREVFDQNMERFLREQYKYDNEGNILLDENGEPVLTTYMSKGYTSDDGQEWSFTTGPVTEEDVALCRELLEYGGVSRTLSYRRNTAVYDILMEEGASYWSGQKPLGNVVDIIGNRLTLYLQEQQ